MTDVELSRAEFAALSAVDGTRAQPKMKQKVEARLRLLQLIERRSWPHGPLWRTDLGNLELRRAPTLES